MSAATPLLRVSHASGLHAVNRVLAEMHREVLRTGGGVVEGGVVRLSVLNLVAACMDSPGAEMAARAVHRLGTKHPARAVVVLSRPDAPPAIEADLSVQCSPVSDGQICAELVRLTVDGEAAYHLASVINPLLVADVPVYLWLVGSPPLHQAFGQDAMAICERLIVDTGEYPDVPATLLQLSRELEAVGGAVSLADIAWERLRVWRRLIAESFDPEPMRSCLRDISCVEVECSGDTVSAQTWLFAGWLAAQLGRAGEAPPRLITAARPHADTAGHGLARVAIHCGRRGHRAMVLVERRGDGLHSVIDRDGGVYAERLLPAPEPPTEDLVPALLEAADEDPVYRSALAAASRLPGGSG